MTAYYVRADTGSDSTGTGSSGAPWKTIGKALSTISPSGSGDTVYVGSGVYRETILPTITPTSASPITITADLDGSATGAAPGEVRLTAYTTNDTTAGVSTATLASNGKSFFTWNGLTACAAKLQAVSIATGSTNWAFNDCTFVGSPTANQNLVAITAGAAAHHAFNRCRFANLAGVGAALNVTLATTGAGADYDADIAVADSFFLGQQGNAVSVGSSGALANFGGGVKVSRCTLFYQTNVKTNGTSLSTSVPCTVAGCVLIGNTGLTAGASGQIADQGYNLIYCVTPLTNVTAGTGTKTDGSYAPLLHFGQEYPIGRLPRHFFAPTSDSPLVGYASGSPTVDLLNRPRPAGNAAAPSTYTPGCLEAHDQGVKETGTVPSGQSTSVKVTGTNDLELKVPVSAAATSIALQVQWDGSYGAGTLPQAILAANGEIGVATQTVTATGSSGAWNTITLAGFTPTGKGEIRIRLASYAAAAGNVFWGAATIAPASPTAGLDHFTRGQPVPYLAAAQAPIFIMEG